jgi:DNA-binding transcriptional LysR family regulator
VVRSLLPDWLRRLRQQHSDIEVSLQEVDEPSFTRLQNGKADLLIDWIDPRPPWTVSTTVAIAFSHLVWPAAWGRKLARTGGPRPEDFLGQPFVAYPRDWAQHGLQQAGLSRLGLTATRELYAKSADSILSFVQAGLGYSLVPWLDQRGPKLPQLCSWRVDEPDATFPIYAIHSQAAAQNPLIDAMLATAPDYPPASTR